MKGKILPLILFSLNILYSQNHTHTENLLNKLIRLDFNNIEENLNNFRNDKNYHHELKTLTNLLYNSGQDKSNDSIAVSKLIKIKPSKQAEHIRSLVLAYYNLFYDKRKEISYSLIFESCSKAKEFNSINSLKLSLLALLKYYSRENTLTKESFAFHIRQYESISSNSIDEAWIVFYKNLFEGRSVIANAKNFENTGIQNLAFLNKNKHKINNSLKSHLYENIGVYYRVFGKSDSAKFYLEKLIQFPDYPFLKKNKFNAYLDLAQIAIAENKIMLSNFYFKNAKNRIDKGDSIKSLITYHLFKSNYYYAAIKKYDSAYHYLKESFKLNRVLNYEENSSKISELNTKLQTAEKEKKIVQLLNINLKSEANRVRNRNLFIGAISFIAIGLVIAFLVYKNSKRKQHIVEQQHEIELQKTEKLLKEQELSAIDAMISGQEKERQRLANDLHDNLGSTLATIKLHFQHLRNNKDNPKIQNIEELYSKTNTLLEEAYQKVRTIAHEKNSGVMANQGLLLAIKNLAKKVSNSNLLVEVQDYGLEQRLDNALEITIFRMIQELITNAIKHAKATEIHISLTNHDSLLNIIVEDNGKGFDAKVLPKKEGMGLANTEKRIEHLEGTFEIDSTIGKGTNIIINIPI